MTISLKYQPAEYITIGEIKLPWGIDRMECRTLLNSAFEASDNMPYMQYRDIYTNYRGGENFFFLNFSPEGKLAEMEIHHGFVVEINDLHIDFSMNIDEAVRIISSISENSKKLSGGEFFFEDLKLAIASSEAMGGNGEDLSYFYCARDVGHLLED